MIVGMPKTKSCTIRATLVDDGSIYVCVSAEGITLAPTVFPRSRYVKSRARDFVELLVQACRSLHGITDIKIDSDCLEVTKDIKHA